MDRQIHNLIEAFENSVEDFGFTEVGRTYQDSIYWAYRTPRAMKELPPSTVHAPSVKNGAFGPF
jgi:hypothetical protein